MMMNRGDLSNERWERLKPLLPPQKPKTGKPNNDHRTVVNGILWILRTGAPWRDLPERYGKLRQWPQGFTDGKKLEFGTEF